MHLPSNFDFLMNASKDLVSKIFDELMINIYYPLEKLLSSMLLLYLEKVFEFDAGLVH